MILGDRLGEAVRVLFKGTTMERAFKALDAGGRFSIQGYPSRPKSFHLHHAAVYLGPLPRHSFLKKVNIFFDAHDAEGAYSDTGVLSVLEQANVQRKEGEKLKIILTGSLREKCNDGEVVFLNFEEQVQRVTGLCQKYLNLKPNDLTFVDMAEEQADLFVPLESAGSLKELFQRRPRSEEWGSYRIAYDLYQAVLEDPLFGEVFKDLMPDGLPKTEDKSEFSLLDAYSLFETAIHLADSIRGQTTQIGVGRQSLYNKVVIDLMQGHSGPWRHLTALHPLFHKVQNETFVGVSVSKSPNPVTSAIRRTRARSRLSVQIGSCALALLGAVEVGGKIEADRMEDASEELTKKISTILQPIQCYEDYTPLPHKIQTQQNKIYAFQEALGELQLTLNIRYGIALSDRAWLLEYVPKFLDHYESLIKKNPQAPCNFISRTHPELGIDEADQFVAANRNHFSALGYNVTRPYAYLGQLNFDTDIPRRLCFGDLGPNTTVHFLGKFSPYDSPLNVIEIFRVEEGSSSYLATEHDSCYSTLDNKKLEGQYKFTVRRAAAQVFWKDVDPNLIDDLHVSQAPVFSVDAKDTSLLKLPDFIDPFGQFHYEIGIYVSWDEQREKAIRSLVAREVNKGPYTTQMADAAFSIVEYFRYPRFTALPPTFDQTTP